MNRPTRQILTLWLDAERRGDGAAAERALALLWSRFERPAPSADFARRTSLRAGGATAGLARWVPPLPRPVRRAVLGIALALTALSLGFLPATLMALVRTWDRVFDLGVGLVGVASERLAHGLTTWNVAARVSRSLVEGLAEPGVVAALSLLFFTSFFAFGWLSQLLAVERSSRHA